MRLSIIIPYYNVKQYTDELLDVLDKQMRNDIEVIVVDDGSKEAYHTDYEWCKVVRKENGGAASARNRGLNETTGEYVQFIDADDLVPDYYVERMLKEIDQKHADVYDFSWKSLDTKGSQHDVRLYSDSDRLHNPSVCTRCFKRSFIGNVRFNEKKDCTEDEDLSRKLGFLKPDGFNHASVTDYMYFYRTSVDNSKWKRFKKGIQKTKRIVYYYEYVTKDMTDLLEEIKKEDETNEIWLVTKRCDIPEMARYARVSYEQRIWGHELRGEYYPGFELIRPPLKTQVCLYISKLNEITGISTWIYNFCLRMKDKKDIVVCYKEMEYRQLMRLIPLVQCETSREIVCDTLIMCSIQDSLPENVTYNKSVQVIHSCKDSIPLPTDRDVLVSVSQTSKDSFGCDSIVIPNLMGIYEKTWLLVSTARIGGTDKGQNNERMIKMANILNKHKIRFHWLYFSNVPLKNAPENMIHVAPTLDILDIMKRADFLVNLSDQEGFCYSIVEALCLNVPVITTDISVLSEIGFKNGIHGFILPFEFTDDDVLKAFKMPVVSLEEKYEYDNAPIIDKWMGLLGDDKPTGGYKYEDSELTVQARITYKDMKLNRDVFKGEVFSVPHDRAYYLKAKEIVDILA